MLIKHLVIIMESTSSPNLARAGTMNIFIAGLVTGTLDATAAIIVYKADPVKMFQYIASAAIGPDAFSGGAATVLLGVFLHYLIATVWCALLYSVYASVHRIVKHWVVVGIAWGIVIWCGMNLAVLPMSRLTLRPFDARQALTAATILILAVGIPAAFIISRRIRR
jgi:hypothetical protein